LRHTGEYVRSETQVGVRTQAQERCDALRVVVAEPEPNERTEVVGDDPHPPEPERVEQREDIGEDLPHRVPVGRRVGPASAPQIGRDRPVALGERRDDLAPLPPVLREAVQEQDGRGIRVPSLGDMHPQAGR
jgi:hypothetical protein